MKMIYDEIHLLEIMKNNLENGFDACYGVDCEECLYDICVEVARSELRYDQLRMVEYLLKRRREATGLPL